jgi:hypothetical protein
LLIEALEECVSVEGAIILVQGVWHVSIFAYFYPELKDWFLRHCLPWVGWE